jgi:dethiobiotin synthetase
VNVFLTGTDTGVGKTFTATAMLRLGRAAGWRCAGMKPICCGDRQDAEHLLAASNEGLTIDEINPVWLRTPVAPFSAALIEGVEIDLALLQGQFAELQARFDFVVVEGVGGWMVPIRKDYFVSNLARDMGLPVMVVAANRLGCLNHTMLTARSVVAQGLECAAIVLNTANQLSDIATTTNRNVLSQITDVPIVAGLTAEMERFPPEWDDIFGVGPNPMTSRIRTQV